MFAFFCVLQQLKNGTSPASLCTSATCRFISVQQINVHGCIRYLRLLITGQTFVRLLTWCLMLSLIQLLPALFFSSSLSSLLLPDIQIQKPRKNCIHKFEIVLSVCNISLLIDKRNQNGKYFANPEHTTKSQNKIQNPETKHQISKTHEPNLKQFWNALQNGKTNYKLAHQLERVGPERGTQRKFNATCQSNHQIRGEDMQQRSVILWSPFKHPLTARVLHRTFMQTAPEIRVHVALVSTTAKKYQHCNNVRDKWRHLAREHRKDLTRKIKEESV